MGDRDRFDLPGGGTGEDAGTQATVVSLRDRRRPVRPAGMRATPRRPPSLHRTHPGPAATATPSFVADVEEPADQAVESRGGDLERARRPAATDASSACRAGAPRSDRRRPGGRASSPSLRIAPDHATGSDRARPGCARRGAVIVLGHGGGVGPGIRHDPGNWSGNVTPTAAERATRARRRRPSRSSEADSSDRVRRFRHATGSAWRWHASAPGSGRPRRKAGREVSEPAPVGHDPVGHTPASRERRPRRRGDRADADHADADRVDADRTPRPRRRAVLTPQAATTGAQEPSAPTDRSGAAAKSSLTSPRPSIPQRWTARESPTPTAPCPRRVRLQPRSPKKGPPCL